MVIPASWTAAILVYVGSFDPPINTATVTWLSGDDVRAWARQVPRWRVAWQGWLAALGLPVAVAVAITLGIWAVRRPVDLGRALPSPALFVGLFLFSMVLSGGLNEEPGWREFAQAQLTSATARSGRVC